MSLKLQTNTCVSKALLVAVELSDLSVVINSTKASFWCFFFLQAHHSSTITDLSKKKHSVLFELCNSNRSILRLLGACHSTCSANP